MKKIYLIGLSFFLLLISYAQIDNVGDTLEGTFNNFEVPVQFLEIPTFASNIWEIGRPSKFQLNQAYSSNKAIITDTINTYPLNNHSYFDLFITAASIPDYPYQIQVEFMHKFVTDTMLDGGYITISYDKGLSWENIIDDSEWHYQENPHQPWGFSNINIYSDTDTLFNGEKGYSGRSNG